MNEDKKDDKTITTLMTTTALPAMAGGFDASTDEANDRLIQGTILSCVDGAWAARDELELPANLIAVQTAQAVQRWKDSRPAETITTPPLPDVEYLNMQIPVETWEEGLDGKPRPPWQHEHIAYLLDPETAALYTFINSTYGAALAVRELRDRVKMMRALRGEKVVPVVELASKPMKTKFGTKLRPFFKITDWRELSGQTMQPVPAPVAPPVKPVPTIEHSSAKPAIERIGSSVEPMTFQEELGDDLPF